MKQHIIYRCIKIGEYIVTNKDTVRGAAKVFNYSKSTVHKDIAHRLKEIDEELHSQVCKVLETNLEERHIRGGIATKKKYLC